LQNPSTLIACFALVFLTALVIAQSPSLPLTARVPGTSPTAAARVQFSDVTSQAGLASFRTVFGTAAKDYIPEATGAGCAFLDYDNDGWLDIYLVNGGSLNQFPPHPPSTVHNPQSALFHNNRDGSFTNVTAKAGVANERFGQGVCAGDFDNDGWTDLYITNFGINRLYRNNRNGTFTDIAERAGVTLGGWSTGCAFGDYDGDGLLDLFVAGYVKFDVNNPPPAASAKVGEQTNSRFPIPNPQSGAMGATFSPDAKYCQYRGTRVFCGPRGMEAERDHLFRNNGNGTFTETTKQAGVEDKAGYYGFGVAWFDADDDGWLDLLVANDSTPNYLYHNQRNGTFTEVGYASGAALNENGREQAHMGVAIGDYDGDGRNDIHITNFSDDTNVLYRNEGNMSFVETTIAAGLGEITIPFLGWGTDFLDYDNDGWLDLFVANGHIYPQLDPVSWGTTYQQRLLLFRNVKSKFYEVGASAGAALYQPRSARGSSIGDFDNDGDLDVLVNNLDEPPTLLRNDGANKAGHWLTVKLIGAPKQKCPRDAIGSVVFCTVNGQRMRAEVASGRGYNSQSDLRVHFGLGTATKVDKLEVQWANGKMESHAISGVDRIITIAQEKK
jgi:enediyne biosynthesis protein E4